MTRDTNSGATRRTFLAGLAGAAAVAAAGPAAAEDGRECEGDVGSETAVSARERATRLREELATLDRRYPALVDRSVLSAVDDQLDAGESSFRLGDHCEATAAFRRASEQARGALVQYYRTASRDHLESVADQLGAAREREPGLPAVQRVETRLGRVRADAEAAETLADWRVVHERAAGLQATADRQLRPSLVDRAVDRSGTAIPALTGLVGAAAGFLASRRRGGDGGPPPDREVAAYETTDD